MQYDITKLKHMRKQLGLTQTEFARAASVSQSLVAKIEAGKIDPTYSKVQQIFEALDRLSKKKELSAREVMQKGMITVKPGDNVVEIVKLMHKRGISQIPVLDGKRVLGLVTEEAIVLRIGDADVQQLKAKDVMIDPPPIVNEETRISALNSLIMYYPIILVARKGEFVGVVTKSDILSKIV
ncbi:CBS domain-containing protein [Candidatus Woesearchaeota archaeon]|nr:CBS domain-containing protein [Candidatus Woesearchaeota archaeon]